MAETIRTNCPRDCYDACGIIVEPGDGDVVRVLGDPDHPVSRGRLCSKCAVAYNGVWQDESARLKFPLRRVGAKGSGEFERISWDDALAAVAENLNATIAAAGAEAILHTHYSGTLSLLAYLFPSRLFYHLGASEVDPDTICNAAGHAAWGYMFGTSGMGFDPRTAEHASCILVWGANPSHTAPHMDEHWLRASQAKVVVVDPIGTETAAAADLHLQPRPGTDAALAFGLLHELRAMGALDETFIDAHTVGGREAVALLADCTPAWTEAQTGVPPEQLRRAAEYYASGPAMLWCGQGLQRQARGGNVMRAVGMLPALTGNVGKPGTGFCYLNYTPEFAGIDMGRIAGAQLIQKRFTSVSHMDLAARLGAGDEFRSLVVWNTNPLASAPAQAELRQAMQRDDLFTVVVDCFETDSTTYADIVLPAAGFLEFDDMTFGYFNLLLGAQAKAREPIGESLPNQEIFRRLARAMGLTEPALFDSDEDLLNAAMAQWNPGFDFEGLKARGHAYITDEAMPMYADLKFDTPSGKIEIASDKAADRGLPRLPEPTIDAPTPTGELRLLTPASKWRLNDSYANDKHLHAQAGAATVHLHPQDAAGVGVEDGQRVRLSNATGSVELLAQYDGSLLPGTALSYKGRWPSLEGGGGTVNYVHTPQKTDMGESTSVHGTRVRIESVD